MNEPQELFREGEYRVVEAHELNTYTLLGWKLRRILSETTLEHFTVEAPTPTQPDGSYYHTPTVSLDQAAPITVHRYLIYRDESTVLEEYAKKQKLAEEAKRTAEKEIEELNERINKQGLHIEDVQRQLARLRESYDQVQGQLTHTREVKAAMERDIAKVRVAIGERQMKDILDGDDHD